WSPPQALGRAADYVEQPAIGFGSDGTALLSWLTRMGAGGLPIKAGHNNDGYAGRLATLSGGIASLRRTLPDSLAPPPAVYARARTLLRTAGFATDHGGQVTAAYGADGTVVVAFARSREVGRRSVREVDAFVARPRRGFGPRLIVGPQNGFTNIAAAVNRAG